MIRIVNFRPARVSICLAVAGMTLQVVQSSEQFAVSGLIIVAKKVNQPGQQCAFDVAGPAFPDCQDLPAGGLQLSLVAAVASDVGFAFGLPEFCVGGRGDFAVAAAVHVPEAAVDENDFSVGWQYKVRLTRKVPAMQTKPEAHLVHKRSYNQFRLRILRSDPRHVE